MIIRCNGDRHSFNESKIINTTLSEGKGGVYWLRIYFDHGEDKRLPFRNSRSASMAQTKIEKLMNKKKLR